MIDHNENTINWLHSFEQALNYYEEPNLIDAYMVAYQEAYGAQYEETYNQVYKETMNESQTDDVEQARYENLLKEHLNTFMTWSSKMIND